MKRDLKTYITLFTSAFTISAFTFGGGFVIIPLMKNKFCHELKWIDEDEILDLISIAQSSPGAIAVNVSVIIGYRIGGLLGAIITAIATITPPFIILSVLSFFYSTFKNHKMFSSLLKGMQAGVAAVILDVAYDLLVAVIKKKEVISILLLISSFIAIYFFNVNLYYLIAIGGLVGVLKVFRQKKGDKSL